jgi:hypothetical protein
MLRKPHALKPLLLGVWDLLQRFIDALRLTGWSPRFGDLDLVEKANSHQIVSCGRHSAKIAA